MTSGGVISHWDDIEAVRNERGHIAASWRSLTGDRSVGVGVRRIEIEPGRWSTPLHVENSEEEIFYVLSGSGVSLQWDGETTEAFAVEGGDCLVHLASKYAHTLGAGPEGLDVLAFGERHYSLGSAYLPRAGVSWGLGMWTRTGDPDDHPWKREAEAGPPDVPDLSARPTRIVNVAATEAERFGKETVRSSWRDLGSVAGSLRTGLNHVEIEPGALMAPPHCHSAEEEIFVVLAGDGELELWPSRRHGGDRETHPLRAGCTVARPSGTHLAHALRAGSGGMTVLGYGTREPNDICFYPRSGKVSLRGVGVIGRLEQLDYWDGED
ncbi:MAG: cupin domain-containing protein [Actinobacteria bacterium]|nr:MAG: cupin domain-containing protein [Actinomycetota bacterium]